MSKENHLTNLTPRENFLMSLLNKVIKEYRSLLEYTKRNKPYKIVEILNLSNIPGETQFIVQVTHKNSILKLTAAEIISSDYNLNDFNDFHAEMIRQAGQGKLIAFLKLSANEPTYKIISKRFDKKVQQYIFTVENNENTRFDSTAAKLSMDKNLLSNMDMEDIYNVGYTNGADSILREKALILTAKK